MATLMNLCRLSLTKQILFHSILMQEVTTHIDVDGAVLVCTRETEDPHDNYAVCIIRNSYVVDHVPLGLSKTFSNFLSLPVSTMLRIVTGKIINRGAGLGLEILVMYQARGHEKELQWLERSITKMVLHAYDLSSKLKSKQFFKNMYFINK